MAKRHERRDEERQDHGKQDEINSSRQRGLQMMNTRSRRAQSVTTMVLGFLALAAIATALGVGTRYGVVDATLARRGIGTVIGAMFVLTGNFLPKMRPLNPPVGDPASTTAAERVAGLILVLVGVADAALFLFARLDLARSISSIIGIGAIAVIAANWAWLARGLLFGGPRTPDGATTPQRAPTQRRRIMIWLLFAIFYLALTACVKVFVTDPAASGKVGTWMLLPFCVLYSLTAYQLNSRRRPKCRSGQPEADDSDAS